MTNETDRELLELAARAAGIDGQYMQDDKCYGTGIVYCDDDIDCLITWNPLEYDGDALRLAVKLGLEVGVRIDMPLGDYSFCRINDGKAVMENHQNYPFAATRRAITRAAAEIGRNMQ